MAGADKIKDKILEEARQQAQFSIDEAQKEVDEILKTAEKEAIQKKEQIISNSKEEAVEREKRMISVAELEARKSKLQAKQDVINEAFNKTYERIQNMPADKYQQTLVKMISDTVKSGDEEIILSEHDKNRVNKNFVKDINSKLKEKGINGNIKLAPETRDITGGFILKQGDVEFNNSFEVIIRMKREELESEVIKALF